MTDEPRERQLRFQGLHGPDDGETARVSDPATAMRFALLTRRSATVTRSRGRRYLRRARALAAHYPNRSTDIRAVPEVCRWPVPFSIRVYLTLTARALGGATRPQLGVGRDSSRGPSSPRSP